MPRPTSSALQLLAPSLLLFLLLLLLTLPACAEDIHFDAQGRGFVTRPRETPPAPTPPLPAARVTALTAAARADAAVAAAYAEGLAPNVRVENDAVASLKGAALERLQALADAGDFAAMVAEAYCWKGGECGAAQDQDRALTLFRRAATEGRNSLAQYAMGSAYYLGAGVAQDFGEAVVWFRLAATQGNPVAAVAMARRYEKGQGVLYDVDMAAVWYEAGARGGEHFAESALKRLGKPRATPTPTPSESS